MNLFLVHHRSPHHAHNSGYSRVLDYLDGKGIYGNTPFPYQLAKMLGNLHKETEGIYNAGSILKGVELYTQLRKKRREKNVVHFLNAERDIRHLGFLKRKFPHTAFCATFHKPPEILKKTIPNVSALKKLDGAIAVGVNQVDFLKEWLQLENVKYIPHGVDTHFFKPDVSKKQSNTLLFVGQHLRDFDTLNYCIPKIAEQIPNLKVNVVIHPAYSNKIKSHRAINIFTNVEDRELLDLYQKTTLLFLPLLDSTACNSLLEALACGLPIITSDVGGNGDYLKGTDNILLPPDDCGAYIHETIGLMKAPAKLTAMGASSIKKAEELEWKLVAEQKKEFYKNLI